jgi:hypothetical protein
MSESELVHAPSPSYASEDSSWEEGEIRQEGNVVEQRNPTRIRTLLAKIDSKSLKLEVTEYEGEKHVTLYCTDGFTMPLDVLYEYLNEVGWEQEEKYEQVKEEEQEGDAVDETEVLENRRQAEFQDITDIALLSIVLCVVAAVVFGWYLASGTRAGC